MSSTTVFNLTERPVRYTDAGNRVPGRGTAVVTDTTDKYYVAALESGRLMVLSESAPPAKQEQVAKPAPDPEPVVVEEVILAEDPVEASEEPVEPESKKKQPSKAKEN